MAATYVNSVPSRMFDPYQHHYQPYQHHYEPMPSRRSMLWRPKTEYLNKTNKKKKKRFSPLELKVPSPPVKHVKPSPVKVNANVRKVTPLHPFSVIPRPHPLHRSPAVTFEGVGRSMVDEQRQRQQMNASSVERTILDWMRISNAQVMEANQRRADDKKHVQTCDQMSCDRCDQIMKNKFSPA